MEPDFTEKERKIGGRVIIETLYNDIIVYVDKETGYYSAAKICRDNGKKMKHLLENQDYSVYKQAISEAAGIPVTELEVVFEGMSGSYQGTWIHPLLVHTVCEWANKLYAVKVSMLMNEIAKQALIEKTTLQERIDREHQRTKTMKDKYKQLAITRDRALKHSKQRCKQESKAHEATKAILANIQTQNAQLIEQNKHLIKDNKKKDKKIDELLSQGYQQLGMLEEAADERHALLAHDEARARDNKLIKSKLNVLCNKVSSLNASNFDEDGSVVFIWVLFRSDSLVLNYTKDVPENAIWIYSQIREDKNKSIPDDAEILFEANVVSRSMYESLVRELEPMTIDTFYRHILISYENAIAFIEKLNELLDARGIHPETYNIETLSSDIETMKAEAELERKREERRVHQVSIRQTIIDEAKFYIYMYGRWRRLYNKNEEDLTTELTASKFFYIRRGAGGAIVERVQSRTLENSRFRAQGDPRINYE